MTETERETRRERVLVPEDFFVYAGAASKTGNSLYRCQNCPPGNISKIISCSDVSRQNLKKHIEHRHAVLLASFEMACDRLRDQKARKNKADTAVGDLSGAPPLKQARLDESMRPLTQHVVDEYVLDYVVESVLPLHHVDMPAFQRYTNKLTARRFAVRCRQTMTKLLEDRFNKRKQQLKEKLATVDYVCTTADCWTSRRRSFLGVTVHWIDAGALERRGSCMAVRQLFGRHTYETLAKALEGIHSEFGIGEKVCFTVTDSGSNFLKAFRLFSMPEADNYSVEPVPTDDINADDEVIEDEARYEEINDLLAAVSTSATEDDVIVYKLPPHRKCACHLLNLVATTDVAKMDGSLQRTATQTFAKLNGLWNSQNRSTLAAEKIRSALGTLLITPGDTRWNSMYDAIKKVNAILADAALAVKFDNVCDNLKIKRLLPLQKTFIAEYVEVMAPISCGIDVLQGEQSASLGYLLPTLTVMKTQLCEMVQRSTPLTLCQALVEALLSAIDRRFVDVLEDPKAKLAAAVHPKFKLDWVDDVTERENLVELLKRSMRQQVGSHQSETEVQLTQPPTTNDFFARLAAKRQTNMNSGLLDVSSEVEKYLSDNSADVSSLTNYPLIRKLYIKLNTGLPASAAVERLFSLGGRVFAPLRSKLSSEHFEMMLFLRASKW